MYIGIDPSSKTGLVILGDDSEVIYAEEITSEQTGPGRMHDILVQVTGKLPANKQIFIEGFSYGSKGKAVDFQYGLGWAIRLQLYKDGNPYSEVSPSQLKKYASGKGNISKDNMILPIYRTWGFEHDSDNVRDAFVLARIAYDLEHDTAQFAYQRAILKDLKAK